MSKDAASRLSFGCRRGQLVEDIKFVIPLQLPFPGCGEPFLLLTGPGHDGLSVLGRQGSQEACD
ncbi:hypothetical protein OHB53_46250 [Streptomyces sp. NBC_00056]|uniref:hypothetical protein n=1 Tax=Streptomyces sp. NBC_00056 TaxID=2975633 RepID=UPI003243C1DD